VADWGFRVKQAGNLARTLFRSKMAIVGLIVLVVYSFLAIAAPWITPYNPQTTIVAGSYSPPSWYRYFNEGVGLSQNLALDSQTAFSADPLQNGWTFTSSNPNFLRSSYDPTTNFLQGSGSLKISLDRSAGVGNFVATFSKTFTWPYRGPPARFIGTIAVKTATASSSEPVQANVFVVRESDHRRWNITDTTPTNATANINNVSWVTYPFNNTAWQVPQTLDSNSQSMGTLLGLVSLRPSELIFSSADRYTYGVTVTFTNASPTGPTQTVYIDDMNLQLYGSSWGLMGTDNTGLDIWSQLIYGARISLMVGLLSAFIGIALGLVVGLIAGYLGKIVDEVLMRFTDMLLVIPGLPLLIVLVSVIGNTFGPGRTFALILIIGFLGWMGFARVVRAQVLSLKERPFVEAAKAAGAGTGHITARHIVPNIVGLIYVNLALAVPGAILSEAALSFLGLGDVTVLSWGRMLNLVESNGAQSIWWWVLPPGLSIALVSLAFVMIGFSLDTLFNPRLRERR
jgi:ABC-type dipeptide/oligopeptide/nickel transport system permease subunit